MKIGMVKTIDGSVYRYIDPTRFRYESIGVTVVTDKGAEIAFPLHNVICFSYEEATDETT